MPPKRSSARQAARAQASTAPAETARKVKTTRAKSTRTLRSKTQDLSSTPQSVRGKRKDRDVRQESVDLGDRPDQRGNKRAKQDRQKSRSATEEQDPSTESRYTSAPEETQDNIDLGTRDATVTTHSNFEDQQVGDSLGNTHSSELYNDEPDLPDVRSPALTGTTARNSHVAQLQDEPDPQQMVDELPELWESSKRLVHLLTPLRAKLEDIVQLKEDLRDPDSLESRNKARYHKQFYDTIEYYTGQSYIDVPRTSLALFRQAEIRGSEVIDAGLRIEDVLFMANLATLVDTDSLATDGTALHETWEYLDREFPLPFFTAFGEAIDKSTLLTESFELALSIRFQHFKSIVVTHSGKEDFNAEEALVSTFFDGASSNHTYKGWNLDAWSDSNLDNVFKALLLQKVEDLQAVIREHNDSESDDLTTRLERLVDNEAFCLQFNQWASLRGKEIEEGFKLRHTGDVKGLQKDLDSMLKGLMASSTRLSISVPAGGADPPSPTAPRGRASVPNVAHRWNTDQNTASNRRILKDLMKKSTPSDLLVSRPETAVTEPGKDASSIPSDNALATPVRVQKVRPRRTLRGSTAKQHGFLDPQANAQQVTLINEGQDSQNDGNDDHIQPNSEEQDGESTQEHDEGEHNINGDDEPAFQNDVRPRMIQRKKRGRPRKNPPSESSWGSRARSSASKIARVQSRADDQQSVPVTSQTGNLPQDTDQEQEAGEAVADEEPVKFRPPRRPWTAEEDDELIKGLTKYKNDFVRYRNIRKECVKEKMLLARRTNVNMKDRARHLKIKFIKAGDTALMPQGLISVPIKTQDAVALRKQGYTWEEPSEDAADAADEDQHEG